MIENYADLNREETIAAVEGFDGQRLRAFIAYERAHKDRTTVIEPLERELVRVRPTDGRQYVAGLWFDDPTEPLPARRSRRVEKAIAGGALKEV